MKTREAIRRQMNELYEIAHGQGPETRHGGSAYDMAMALEWVIGKTTWTPVSSLREYYDPKKKQ
jgi:hypothetical protein